jgi:glycosyltransferase involved in cell wall biosynthesis
VDGHTVASTVRVCHIIESAGGGSGQVLIDLATAQVNAGDDVTIVYAVQRAEPLFLAALSAIGPRVRVLPVPMRREISLHDLIALVRLYPLLRRAGPFDIVHSHSSKAGALARLAGLFLPQAIQIYTPHAFQTMAQDAPRHYAWIEWFLSWFCTAIICTSAHELQHARARLKIAARKLHVIPNGVKFEYPNNRKPVRARLGYSDKDYVVGFIGRLVPQKNPQRLANAFAIAASRLPYLRLAIVGDGPLRDEVDGALKSLSIANRTVILAGHSGRELIPSFDCLLCSSDYESFGLVIIEALAAGVPVVSTPVGIAHDAILPGKTGFISPDFRPESLASSIVELAALDAASRKVWGKAAAERAANFDVEKMSRRTRALYVELLSLRNAALLERSSKTKLFRLERSITAEKYVAHDVHAEEPAESQG